MHSDAGGCSADAGRTDRAWPTTLAVLETRTLLLAALTGTSIPLMFAGAAAAFGRIRDVLPERVLHRITGEVFGGGRTTVLILLAAVVAAVIAGIVLTSLRLANFTLVRDGDRLRISRGLLAQRSGTIPVDRVQAVRVVAGLVAAHARLLRTRGRSRGHQHLQRRRADAVPAGQDCVRRPSWWRGPCPSCAGTPARCSPVPAGARRRYLTLPSCWRSSVTAGLAAAARLGLRTWRIAPIPLALLVGWRRRPPRPGRSTSTP